MPFTDVAFAAGFSSIRQFNDTVREVFALSPSELRARVRTVPASGSAIQLRLPYRAPFDVAGAARVPRPADDRRRRGRVG